MNVKVFLNFYLLCVNILFTIGDGGVYQNIVKNIFKNYDTGLRPVLQSNTTTTVKLHYGIVQLLSVNQISKTFDCQMFMEMIWHDELLKWNPEEFGNTNVVQYPAKNVWLPDIILVNSPDSKQGTTADVSTNVIINSDGTVYNDFITVYKTYCDTMDMSKFPFDEHHCHLEFESWTYSIDQLDIVDDMPNYRIPENVQLKQNPEWTISVDKANRIVNHACCPNASYPKIRIPIKLTRKPLYYIATFLLPITVTCTVCFIGMFCPSTSSGERTEKVFLGITTLLAVSLLMFSVSSQLPVTSNGIPTVGLFLGMYLVTISIGVMCTTIIMQVDTYGLNGKPLPKWARIVFIEWFGKFLLSTNFQNKNEAEVDKISQKTVEQEKISTKNENSNEQNLQVTISHVIARIDVTLDVLVQEKLEKRNRERIRNEWSLCGVIIDRICLIVFLSFTFIFTFVLFST